MSHSITTSTTRSARVTHAGRDGITIAHLLEFIADCQKAGIPASARVRFEDRLGEGANRSGYIEAWHKDEPDDTVAAR